MGSIRSADDHLPAAPTRFAAIPRAPAADTEALLASGHDAVLVIDVQGARKVRARGIETSAVFVMPPSEQLVSGSAIVRPQQEADAVARAVLDATNRRIAYISAV